MQRRSIDDQWYIDICDRVDASLAKLHDITDINQLERLLAGVHIVNQSHIYHYAPAPREAYMVYQQMLEMTPEWYKQDLVITKGEFANGYELYETNGPIMRYGQFIEFLEANEGEGDDDFGVCSDWAKIDELGNSFGGFYEYGRDSEEYKHAFKLTLDKNLRLLRKLPFPPNLIRASVTYGCGRRDESVRESNFYCTWVLRKLAQSMEQ